MVVSELLVLTVVVSWLELFKVGGPVKLLNK